MNLKPLLKVKHQVEDLISYIEKNELENVKKIISSNKSILKKKENEELEPIFYSVKYKCNKIFEFILQNSQDIKYNVN
jgi:hypothetical protein